MSESERLSISRRRFLQIAAATGVVVACGPAASGPAATGGAAAAGKPTGTVTVSYPDEAGFKPKYVEQAAAAVKAQFSGVDVKIDHQKIGSDDFYTKLLLRLDGNDVPDVIHVGGNLIGELADAGYIEPLDAYTAQWGDWKQYPDSVRSGVTYKSKLWAIPYGLDMRWLYYRKDDFQKSGLPADWKPANVQGILDAATAVKKANLPNVLPYALYAGPSGSGGSAEHAFVPLLWAYGGELQDKERQVDRRQPGHPQGHGLLQAGLRRPESERDPHRDQALDGDAREGRERPARPAVRGWLGLRRLGQEGQGRGPKRTSATSCIRPRTAVPRSPSAVRGPAGTSRPRARTSRPPGSSSRR